MTHGFFSIQYKDEQKMKVGSPFTAQAGFDLSNLLPWPEMILLNNKKKCDSRFEKLGLTYKSF